MFASIVSGALISLLLFYLAPLPLMVAALGWGATGAAIGGLIGARSGSAHCSACSYCHRLPRHRRGAGLLARPSGAARAPCRAGHRCALTSPRAGMVSGRPHHGLDRGLRRADHDGALLTLGTDGATITEGLRSGLLRVMGDAARRPRRHRPAGRRAGYDRAAGRRDGGDADLDRSICGSPARSPRPPDGCSGRGRI